jgi:hypothetical protein
MSRLLSEFNNLDKSRFEAAEGGNYSGFRWVRDKPFNAENSLATMIYFLWLSRLTTEESNHYLQTAIVF